jgi:ParB/RepB/Spo0J family partition protein
MPVTAASPAKFALVAIDLVHESPWNPRKHWDAAADAELLASVRQVGVLTPMLVRPRSPFAPDGYELAAGHRRLRAARAAGLTEIPVLIRAMDDGAFREVLVVENLQRADIHPLDEADGYDALLQADGAYTVEAVAAKVGKSPSYVYQRLKLLHLVPACRQAFEADQITAAHAVRLARLTAEQQPQALEECFYPIFRLPDEDHKEPAPVSKLDAWIDRHVREQLAAPDTQHYFPEIAEQITEEQQAGTLLELSESYHVNVDLGTKTHGALGAGRWTAIRTTKDRCAHAQKGVVVHGGPMRVLDVCATKGCPKHFPVRKTSRSSTTSRPAGESSTDRWKREEEERARQRKRWEKLKPLAYAALGQKMRKVTLTDALVREVVKALRDHRTSAADVEKAIGVIGVDTAARAFAFVLAVDHCWGLDEFRKIAKTHGIDLAPLLKQVDAELEPKQASPTTKTATKTATKARTRR